MGDVTAAPSRIKMSQCREIIQKIIMYVTTKIYQIKYKINCKVCALNYDI